MNDGDPERTHHAGQDETGKRREVPDVADLEADHPEELDSAFDRLEAGHPGQDPVDPLADVDQQDPRERKQRDSDVIQSVAACRYCGREFSRSHRAREHGRFCRKRYAAENDAETPGPEGAIPPADENGERYLLSGQWHEFRAFLKYGKEYDELRDEHRGIYGLEPYFALVSTYKSHDWSDGPLAGSFEFDGRHYSYELTYNGNAPIAPWSDPSFRLENVVEFRIKCRGPEDVRKATFKISPRWPDMEHVEEDKQGINNPRGLIGVDVDTKGSNHHPRDYPRLLSAVASALGVNGPSSTDRADYFDPDRVRPWSVVVDGELYVRVHDDHAVKLWNKTGPLERMGLFLQDLHEGYREHVADDTKTSGYRHVAAVGPHRAGELISDHRLAKQAKVYHMREPDAQTGATKHPKLGIKYRNKIQRKSQEGTVYWQDLDHFERELDETLLNVLGWAGLPVRPRKDVYVSDAVFTVEGERRAARIVPDPLPALQEQQQERITRLVNQATESDADVIHRLIADGGEAAPKDLADQTGWSYDTVLESLARLEGVVRHERGSVTVASQFLAEELLKSLSAVKDSLEYGVSVVERDLERVLSQEGLGSSFGRWAERYDVDIEDPEDKAWKVLRFGYTPSSWDHAKRILREGWGAVLQDGLGHLLRDARIDLRSADGAAPDKTRFALEGAHSLTKHHGSRVAAPR